MIVSIRARPFHPCTLHNSTAIPSDKLGQESAEIAFSLPSRTSVIPIASVANSSANIGLKNPVSFLSILSKNREWAVLDCSEMRRLRNLRIARNPHKQGSCE
jgi:hypothetical protein